MGNRSSHWYRKKKRLGLELGLKENCVTTPQHMRCGEGSKHRPIPPGSGLLTAVRPVAFVSKGES
jgi:hypothetical protein